MTTLEEVVQKGIEEVADKYELDEYLVACIIDDFDAWVKATCSHSIIIYNN